MRDCFSFICNRVGTWFRIKLERECLSPHGVLHKGGVSQMFLRLSFLTASHLELEVWMLEAPGFLKSLTDLLLVTVLPSVSTFSSGRQKVMF